MLSRPPSHGGPIVRIHLPPAKSPLRTMQVWSGLARWLLGREPSGAGCRRSALRPRHDRRCRSFTELRFCRYQGPRSRARCRRRQRRAANGGPGPRNSSRATAAKAASTRGSLTPPAAVTCFTKARRMIFSVRARDPSAYGWWGRAQDSMAGAGGSRARFRSWSCRRVETGLTLSTLNVAEPRSRAIFTPLARSLRFLPAASPAAATDPRLPPVRRV